MQESALIMMHKGDSKSRSETAHTPGRKDLRGRHHVRNTIMWNQRTVRKVKRKQVSNRKGVWKANGAKKTVGWSKLWDAGISQAP